MDNIMYGVFGGALAFVLPKLASRVAAWFRSGSKPATEFLTTLDEKIEERIGVDLPEWMHRAYDTAVMQGVSFAESVFGTDQFWKSVFFILRGQPDKIAERMLNLMAGIDWSKGLDQVMPPELKAFINDVKEQKALPQVKANLMCIPVGVRPDDAQILEDVKTMAPALGKTIDPIKEVCEPQVSNAEIQSRIAATKAKLLRHIANLDEKK